MWKNKERVCLNFVPPSAAYYLPRHLAPAPGYPHPYPHYLIRGFPDTAALENRHTLFTDYITSQQMHQWPAAAMTQRSDLLRAPRDSPLPLSYSPSTRGTHTHASVSPILTTTLRVTINGLKKKYDVSLVICLIVSSLPSGASASQMERINYHPGTPTTFPSRVYTTSPISPGTHTHTHTYTRAHSQRSG